MRLTDHTFVVFDTETTGLSAEQDRVIEIGAIKLVEGKVAGHFSSLINPSRYIPRQITALTGITTAMTTQAPAAPEVWADFLTFIEGATLVAHNLSFDEGFMEAELERCELPDAENPRLCTLRLARRLLPRLPSRGLKSLADHFGIRMQRQHRALDDAEATARILIRLLEMLEAEFKIQSIEDLIRWQFKRYADTKGEPKHIQTIRARLLPSLPELPGVYRMYNHRKQLIYVGKARRLRQRVSSYFRAIEGHPKKTQNLVREVRHIEWDVVPSELDALMLESRLIKAHLPKFNRALVRYRNIPFLALETTHPFPKITWRYALNSDENEYFGPLSNREQAEQAIDLINRMFKLRECDESTFRRGRPCVYHEMGRCDAPCAKPEAAAAYTTQVELVRNFLIGQDAAVLNTLHTQMQIAAAQMAYEDARWYRDQIRTFERMFTTRRHIAAPVRAHNGVLFHPEDQSVLLHIIRFGRKVETLRFSAEGWLQNETIREVLREKIATHFQPNQTPPERYGKQEVDEIRILAQWMYLQRGKFIALTWAPDATDFAEDVYWTMHASLGSTKPSD